MPKFHLIPTLTEACPECQTEAVIPFVAGRQVMKCEKCEANLSFDLPAAAVKDLLDRVKQVEQALDAAINRG